MSDTIEGDITLEHVEEEYKEAMSIFPALHKYKKEHNTANLQKLCVEVTEFCKSIYASTQNDDERKVYLSMLEKLNKK